MTHGRDHPRPRGSHGADRVPGAGLHERATADEIRTYYADVLDRRLRGSGRVRFLGGHEYHLDGDAHVATSRLSGDQVEVRVRQRVVDATWLAPSIPATTPPPFEVADGARVIPVNDLVTVADAPARYVIAGSGKTATDAVVWLVGNGVAPDRITWVRPRDPWMLDRAVVQPDPAVAAAMTADVLAAATDAESPDDLFLRMEAVGVMLRIDPDVVPTMAKTPTLGRWEVDLLRTVHDVVRMGHIRAVSRHELVLDRGVVPLLPDTLVVHCAAPGLRYPPMVPIWARDRIRLQTIRAGFPCFGAALAGYVEATRDDDRERNWLCPPNTYADRVDDWARMFTRGTVAVQRFTAETDIADWANDCVLNPARVPADRARDGDVVAARARVADLTDDGLAAMVALGGAHPWGDGSAVPGVRGDGLEPPTSAL